MSDIDVDDELLALAGGDAYSDEEEEMDMSRDNSRSPSPPPAAKRKDAQRGVAAKKGTPKATKRRPRDDDGSEDEGEASSVPSSPASQQSVPMDESDSDADSPQTKPRAGDDEINQYPVDGLFRDYEEKARILSMREIEREQFLAERREENERIRQNRMLRQLKVNQEKDIKKRKASAADLDDGQRKASRIRTKAGETSDKMDSLRRAREERTNRKEQREREDDRRKQSPSYRRGRDDEDSDVDWMGPSKSKQRSRSPDIRESLPAELRDVERIRVGRSRFAEVCFYPGFEEAITGCYVRINIGPSPENGQDIYRMAVIKGFNQGRPYAITDGTGNQMVVDLYVKAAHGKAQREWPFISCSDRGFTEAEWDRYKKVCVAEGVTVPEKMAFINKIDDINRLVKRKWTDEELSVKTKRQAELYSRFSGVERESLIEAIERARSRGDEEHAAKLQDKLDHLEVPRLAFKTSLKPRQEKKKEMSQQEKLALINLENRKRNSESVRKAQLKERGHIRELQKRFERGDLGSSQTENGNAPGTPAKTSGANTPANGTSTPKQDMAHIQKLQELQRSQAKNGVPAIVKPLMDDDIIGALDLDVDLDI